jgi:hypothetical protein
MQPEAWNRFDEWAPIGFRHSHVALRPPRQRIRALAATGRIHTAEGAPSFDAAFFVGHVPDVPSRLLVRSCADHGTGYRGQL